MAKYDNSAQYSIPGIYKINAAAPIDSREVVTNKKDLLLRSTFPNNGTNIYVYEGMQVYVEESKQTYVLKQNKKYSDFYESIDDDVDIDNVLSTFGWEINNTTLKWMSFPTT